MSPAGLVGEIIRSQTKILWASGSQARTKWFTGSRFCRQQIWPGLARCFSVSHSNARSPTFKLQQSHSHIDNTEISNHCTENLISPCEKKHVLGIPDTWANKVKFLCLASHPGPPGSRVWTLIQIKCEIPILDQVSTCYLRRNCTPHQNRMYSSHDRQWS